MKSVNIKKVKKKSHIWQYFDAGSSFMDQKRDYTVSYRIIGTLGKDGFKKLLFEVNLLENKK